MIAFLCLLVGCLSGCEDRSAEKEAEETAVETAVEVEEVEEPWSPSWDTCSYKLDDHACDFTLLDQNGKEWQLYSDENRGDIIVLDLTAMWCGPCKMAAAEAQEIHDLYKDKGVQYVSILIDNAQGEAPTMDDIQQWVQQYGFTDALILAGSRDMVDYNAETGFPTTSWPTFLLIDRDLVVRWGLHGYSRQMIEDAINAQLALDNPQPE